LGPTDLDNVKEVQAGYQVQALSAFLNKPAPPAPAEIKWPKIDKELAEADPFASLHFVLRFCPTVGASGDLKLARRTGSRRSAWQLLNLLT
jgi:hypothetical protein